MRAIDGPVKTDGRDPLVHHAGILPGRDMRRVSESAWKQALLRLQRRLRDPRGDRGPRGFRQLKLYGPLCLSLHDHRPAQDLAAVRNVANTQIDEITATQLAVDREIEHCQVSNPAPILQVDADGPDILGFEGRLLADQFAFVLGFPMLIGFHDRLLRC